MSCIVNRTCVTCMAALASLAWMASGHVCGADSPNKAPFSNRSTPSRALPYI